MYYLSGLAVSSVVRYQGTVTWLFFFFFDHADGEHDSLFSSAYLGIPSTCQDTYAGTIVFSSLLENSGVERVEGRSNDYKLDRE